jgi:TPR repeat protein
MTDVLQDTLIKAEGGDTAAMKLLSKWYYLGWESLKPSAEKSFEWTMRAAEAGDAEAQRHAGAKIEFAEGTPKDMLKAFAWYKKAYDAGDAQAAFHLAQFFEGRKGLEAHLPTAMAYYEEGARRGCGRCQYHLALRCLTGRGVPRDPTRAVDLFEQAAQNGMPGALEFMGTLYLEGRDVPKDEGLAFDCFSRALAFHDYDQMVLLTGTGCDKNTALGREALQISASAGNPAAQQILETGKVGDPMVQACFGFDTNAHFAKTGNIDWDISGLLK